MAPEPKRCHSRIFSGTGCMVRKQALALVNLVAVRLDTSSSRCFTRRWSEAKCSSRRCASLTSTRYASGPAKYSVVATFGFGRVYETRYSSSNSCNSPINNKLLANISKTSNHVDLSLIRCGRATFPTWENCRANHWQYKYRVQKLFEQHPALESWNSSTHSNYHHNHDDDEDPLRHLPLSSHYYLPHICLWIGYPGSHYKEFLNEEMYGCEGKRCWSEPEADRGWYACDTVSGLLWFAN